MFPGKAKWYHIMKGSHKLMKTRFNRIENMRLESTPRNKKCSSHNDKCTAHNITSTNHNEICAQLNENEPNERNIINHNIKKLSLRQFEHIP